MKANIGLIVNGGKVSLGAKVDGQDFAIKFQGTPESAEAIVQALLESLSRASANAASMCESTTSGS